MIARALIKKPKILLFDEPTSVLEAISHQKIIQTLQNLPLTKVAVTHRLSSIEPADMIYVVEKGRLSDQGIFSIFLKKSPLFRQLAALKE